MLCLPCDFKILLTVFNQSYNCQTSHYLGRNQVPKPFLILPPWSDSIYMFVLTIDLTKLCQRICVASRDYKLGQYFCVHKSTTCNDSLLHAIIQFTAWKSFQSLQYTSWLLFFTSHF